MQDRNGHIPAIDISALFGQAAPARDEADLSIPFFYEPRVDAGIAPLPVAGGGDFAPFLYGDHLWESATNFVEMAGVKDLRKPRGAAAHRS